MSLSSISPVIPDFDMLLRLHVQDHDAFEALRRHLLQDAVNAAPLAQRPALNKLLNNIEAARASARTPLEAATKAFDLMSDSVKELHAVWQQVGETLSEMQTRLLIERVR